MKFTALFVSASLILALALTIPRLHTGGSGTEETLTAGKQAPSGKVLLTEGKEEGICLTSAEIALADFEAYGVSPIAETAYTLTATVNEDATVKAVNWSVAWENASSEWATGKTVTDYVTLSNMGDLTATVSCLQAFGEAVIVSAASRDDPAVKATCQCDYRARVVGASMRFQDDSGSEHNNTGTEGAGELWGKLSFNVSAGTFICQAMWGLGSIQPYFTSVRAELTLKVNQEVIAKLQDKGYVIDSASTVVLSSQQKGSPYSLGEDELKSLFGSNATADGKLYEVLKEIQAENIHKILEGTVVFSFTSTDDFGTIFGSVVGYYDIDAESFYTPVSDVQVDQTDLKF